MNRDIKKKAEELFYDYRKNKTMLEAADGRRGDAALKCAVVEATLKRYGERGEELVKKRFFERKSIWALEGELYSSKSRIYELINEMVMYAAAVAAQYGLINVA